jgi:hypothetical protein
MLWGSLAGFIGILFIARPFLQEACGTKKLEETSAPETPRTFAVQLGEFAAVSLGAVSILNFSNPLHGIGIFEGDYLASFFLLSGIILVSLNWKAVRSAGQTKFSTIFGPAFAGMVLLLLITGWFELTNSEAWITSAKWPKFPLLLIATFPYCLGEEMVLGAASRFQRWIRTACGLGLRLVGWLALLAGILALHSGEILILLLAPYIALFYLLQRRGMDIVRERTGSATAAALFGAILLAGLCLVIFPIT